MSSILGFKSHYHHRMSMMVIKSFPIVLGMADSETYSLKNNPPKEISLKNLIDTRRQILFIFVCFGWMLDSGCWATNQG
jgi:hypothetical protein